MTEETTTKKPSPLSKIVAILDKLPLDKAVSELEEVQNWLREKIGMHRDELTNLQNKLPKKEN